MAKDDQPTIEPYSGTATNMRESDFLASEDFAVEGGGYSQEVVTIVKVFERRNITFKDGRTKKKGYTLKLREKERELLINATNRDTLKALFGNDSTKWLGKQILLWIDPHVKLKKEIVPGIRIKPVPKQAKPELSRIEKFRGWLKRKELPESDATAQIGNRTLEDATEEDWATLKTWTEQFTKGTP